MPAEQNPNNDQQLVPSNNPLIPHSTKPMVDLVVIKGQNQERFVEAVFKDVAFSKTNREESVKRLIVLIGTWVYKLGVKKNEVPKGNEVKMLAEWIFDQYPMFTFKEIEMAIDLSLIGKLDIRETNIFGGTLSIQYMSTVLNAYKVYRYPRMQIIADQTADYIYKNALPSPVPSPEEQLEQMKGIITNEYNRYKSTGTIMDFNNIIWNYLKFSGLLEAGKNLQHEAMEKANQRLAEILSEPISNTNGKLLTNWFKSNVRLKYKSDPEEAQKIFAREYVMKKYFDAKQLNEILERMVIKHFLPKTENNGKPVQT